MTLGEADVVGGEDLHVVLKQGGNSLVGLVKAEDHDGSVRKEPL